MPKNFARLRRASIKTFSGPNLTKKMQKFRASLSSAKIFTIEFLKNAFIKHEIFEKDYERGKISMINIKSKKYGKPKNPSSITPPWKN